MFERFHGNLTVQRALERMLDSVRMPQTLLFSGPEGVGKATLARRFAVRLLGSDAKIEHDDLSLDHNRGVLAERERWPSEKRVEDPLLFSTHPDFVTFCPDGPLRQISIQQMRLLRERAQLLPLKGQRRVFLIDQLDRANAQATDTLLKTLEEPPPHLLLLLTAENAYDLPPTVRSRAVELHLAPLSEGEMRAFLEEKGADAVEHRLALAAGSPGLALTLDVAVYEKRRATMMALLEAASGHAPFGRWVKESESLLASKSEKLDLYFRPLYLLLEDLLVLQHAKGAAIRNRDLHSSLEALARRLSFDWIREAVERVDELVTLQRRNVQKGPALDNLVVTLRAQ
jgi:DNA polymerase-3 subunit delta'